MTAAVTAKNERRFITRVIAAVIAVYMLTVSLITLYNYRLANVAVMSATQMYLDVFTERILSEIENLEVILSTTIQIMNDEHIAIAYAINYILEDAQETDLTPEALQRLAGPLGIIELNLADPRGILTHSNVPELIGFNYNDFEETRIYLTLTTGTLTEIREEPRQSVLDENEYGATNHYAGVSRTGGGFIQLGFDASVIWKFYEQFDIAQVVRNISIGDHGYGIVVTDGVISSHPDSAKLGTDVTGYDWYKSIDSEHGYAWFDIDGGRYYAGYLNVNNRLVVGLVPEAEFYRESRDLLSRSLVLLLISVAVIIPVIYLSLIMLLRGRKTAAGEEFLDDKRIEDGHP